MSHKTVAEIVVETLQSAGVRHCWGVPGDTLNYVTDAIRRSEIEWVHVRHEEVGGFAAGAEALLSGNLTACAGSCGPGSLHFINGLFESHRNRAPVVLIASQIINDEQGFDFPFIHSQKGVIHKTPGSRGRISRVHPAHPPILESCATQAEE
jgi:pyruvate dehydrogenase (quinone)